MTAMSCAALKRENDLKRIARLKKARTKGTHTDSQWQALKLEFKNRCVRCGIVCLLKKDHITPLYRGGSDSIENIQPLCPFCSSSKTNEDFNWAEFRRTKGWAFLVPRLNYRGKPV
jgi:5-methylcytosine-specific restriction endonuclease McrA